MRLPGKVLKPLGNLSITEHLLHRLSTSKRAALVAMATSDDPRDRVLVELAAKAGFNSFCGHPDDKLIRYRDAARIFCLDFVVVVDGDDPFVSVHHIDQIIETYLTDGGDYIIVEGLPLGATGFGVSASALERICENRPEENTEIWGHYFTENRNYRCVFLEEKDKCLARPEIRMTLDYPEDYKFFVTVFNCLAVRGQTPEFEKVMKLLASRPDVAAINQYAHEHYQSLHNVRN